MSAHYMCETQGTVRKGRKTKGKSHTKAQQRCSQTLIGTSTLFIGVNAKKNHVRKANLRENENERNKKSNKRLTSNMDIAMKPREVTDMEHGTK